MEPIAKIALKPLEVFFVCHVCEAVEWNKFEGGRELWGANLICNLKAESLNVVTACNKPRFNRHVSISVLETEFGASEIIRYSFSGAMYKLLW